jgi:diguanylate cyclase (GGDEF)-like protein
MAEAIRQRAADLRIPHARTGNDVKHITVSIGVATQQPQQQLAISALIGAADRALYLAKRAGRNRVMVQPL